MLTTDSMEASCPAPLELGSLMHLLREDQERLGFVLMLVEATARQPEKLEQKQTGQRTTTQKLERTADELLQEGEPLPKVILLLVV